jgi:2-hydroxychromene-2-carboxylate isomerase
VAKAPNGTASVATIEPPTHSPHVDDPVTSSAASAYSESMFKAIFAEGLPEIGEGECLERAEAVGMSREAFARELASPGPARRLAETAEEAHSAGAFGVPTFVVEDRMFWGNDRLVLVRHYLKK